MSGNYARSPGSVVKVGDKHKIDEAMKAGLSKSRLNMMIEKIIGGKESKANDIIRESLLD